MNLELEQLNSKEMQKTIMSPEEIRKQAGELGTDISTETTGQLKFDLDNVKQEISSLRREKDKERRSIVDDKNMELKDKVSQLKKFDEDTKVVLSPLEQQRDKIEGILSLGGHA